MNAEVLEKFLDYVYTGEVEVTIWIFIIVVFLFLGGVVCLFYSCIFVLGQSCLFVCLFYSCIFVLGQCCTKQIKNTFRFWLRHSDLIFWDQVLMIVTLTRNFLILGWVVFIL